MVAAHTTVCEPQELPGLWGRKIPTAIAKGAIQVLTN